MKQLRSFLEVSLYQLLFTCIVIIWYSFPIYKHTQKNDSTFYTIPVFLNSGTTLSLVAIAENHYSQNEQNLTDNTSWNSAISQSS